jgi:hypothetical protein
MVNAGLVHRKTAAIDTRLPDAPAIDAVGPIAPSPQRG